MKSLALLTSILITLSFSTQASLVLIGVIEGDLSGGTPKAVLAEVTADIADLSTYGIGSANNGGGTDGEEFMLSGSVTAGQTVIIAGNSASFNFFNDNYATGNLSLFTSSSANINGDDAIELFSGGLVIDTYGDINTSGTGESWDYTDGYAVRTGGSAGAFVQANYSSNVGVLDTLDEANHITTLATAFNLDPVPEPSAGLLGVIGLTTLLLRRRRLC